MVAGLSSQEWQLLREKTGGSDRFQMISGVEEAVVRGLSHSGGPPDEQTELKNSWNVWALKLCDGELHLVRLPSMLQPHCPACRVAHRVSPQRNLVARTSAASACCSVP
jgi:hypothetical protein